MDAGTHNGGEIVVMLQRQAGVFAYMISSNSHNHMMDITKVLMRRWRQREVKEHLRNDTAKKWGSWA